MIGLIRKDFYLNRKIIFAFLTMCLVYAVMMTIAKGPLDSAKRNAIEKVSTYSVTRFLAEMFYTDEEIADYTDITIRHAST